MSDNETVAAEVAALPTDPTPLDAIITVASHREYFDEKELTGFINGLREKGIVHEDSFKMMTDWVQARTYISGNLVMDTMLDIRNVVAPYTTAITEQEEVSENADPSDVL